MPYQPSPQAKAIEQDAVKKVTDLERECTASRAQVADVIASLEDAVERNDRPMLDLYLKRVDPTSKLLVDTISDAVKAIEAVKLLEGADGGAYLEAKFKEIKDLTQKADRIKATLSGQLVEVKSLQKAALKATEGAQGGQSDAVAKYAQLEDRVNDKKAAMEKKQRDLDAQVAAADKAWAAKDQKKLTDARVKIIDMDFGKDAVELGQLDRELADFIKKHKDSDLTTDANWAKDEVYKMQGIAAEGKSQMQRLVKLGQVPVAAAKTAKPAKLTGSQIAALAKHFPVDPKDSKAVAKFGKVLNEEPHGKWADQLVREFGWKKSEVQAGMSKANQAPFVKSLYLIDI
jgi:hypothetical protein